jgi:RTX calcium-binding nonapeptide repeat (4 copies)
MPSPIRNRFVRRATLGVTAIAAAMLATGSAALAATIRGTPDNDTLVGTAQADVIFGYAGNDELYAGQGGDRVDGGPGKDHIWGGNGNDVIVGGPPGDFAGHTPYWRHERIFGGAGNDVIVMRVAGSILFGGPGDDRIDVRDPQTRCRARRSLRAVWPQRALDPPHCVNLVNTGPGDNYVRADDGSHDSISCVGRRDRVVIDQYDVAGPDCEIMRRVHR